MEIHTGSIICLNKNSMKINKLIFLLFSFVLFIGCSKPVVITKEYDKLPDIYPDYINVTIPPNIAPLNFRLNTPFEEALVKLKSENYDFEVKATNGQFTFPQNKWRKLLELSTGKDISLTVCAKEKGEWISYATFSMHVVKDSIDSYLAYRLIEPGYEVWNQMGIYQRNLENYDQTPILENKTVGNSCMNCHSFRMQDPTNMLLHTRGTYPSTMLIRGDTIEKLNTRTAETMSALVYPSWHPSGRYIAFSVNDTYQEFHTSDRKRVEVYDRASDVVVYDIEKHELLTAPELFSETQFESFPTFSPDGKTLYYGSADSCSMPNRFKDVKYSLCAISFDPINRKFGNVVDTIFNAKLENKSASFPRVSPDGKYLLYTRGDYGSFFIWHKEADLYIYNLESRKHYPLEAANSDDAESYHSWSSNSRWIVFSSRRIDGLYTRPFIAHIDENGIAGKAFVLPQKDTKYYDESMKSFNVPELVKGKVEASGYSIAQKVKSDPGTNIKFKSSSTNKQ